MGRFVTRPRGSEWQVWRNDDNTYPSEQVTHAVLMDIRDELQKLNRVFSCPNFQQVPEVLRQIQRNTKKRKRPRIVGKPKLRVVTR